MSNPETPKKSTDDLRALLTEQANSWLSAQVELITLKLAITGLGHIHGSRNEPLWEGVIVLGEKLTSLATIAERNHALLTERLATIGVATDESARNVH